MRAFEYANPSTLDEAVELLTGSESALPLAGGTDLLSLLKDDLARPDRLVNLKSIPELSGVEVADDGVLRIGAMTTLAELLASEAVADRMPSLVQAAQGIRSPQLHTMGTVGGDLLQRPRCWYYRAGFGLLAREDGRSMVVDGDNRYHAILGTDGPAYFVNPSSLAPALIALGARARVHGPDGGREVAVEELFRNPASEGELELTVGAGEILTEVTVPATPSANATYEVRQKEALDWPLAAAAVAIESDGTVVTGARVVLGHVGPVPHVAKAAADALIGKSAAAGADEAAAAAVSGAKALSGNGYKIQLAKVATRRAIHRALGMEV
ncbi:MAG: FAD binding domain-containing protein [Acidobacteriota bacterium]|nr:FAD binding domain-containing protein [Acidobacteriota bacterium]